MKKEKELLELAVEAALIAGERTLKFYKHEMDVIVKDDHSPLTLADLEANQIITDMLSLSDIPVLSEESKVTAYGIRRNWKRLWLVDPLDGTKEFINRSAEYTVNIALIEKGRPILGVVYAPALGILYFGSEHEGSYKQVVNKEDSVHAIIRGAKKLESVKLNKLLRVVASRSHLSKETQSFIDQLGKKAKIGDMHSYGSSLKLCMVAEGSADIYPRLGPTMEWDTAASHAVALFAGCEVIDANSGEEVIYNKEDLLNPWFIVYNKKLKEIVGKLLKV